jgi:hypothetical protein
MRYAMQMCECQPSGPPKVVKQSIEMFPLDHMKQLAKAHLDAAPIDGKILTDYGWRPAEAIFIRVVELDSSGSPTDRVEFEYKLPD